MLTLLMNSQRASVRLEVGDEWTFLSSVPRRDSGDNKPVAKAFGTGMRQLNEALSQPKHMPVLGK